ncbi:uncharacterized protein [Hyperolius riggenbachi]|uniref:uncharacterized protein isoform X2 n=1 Tax=Hyperolius riggenbachi TaxID=752182 RepID=UPI0035A30518
MDLKGFIVLFSLYHTAANMELDVNPLREAQLGEDITIQHSLLGIKDRPLDPKFLEVVWFLQGEKVYHYSKDVNEGNPRMSVNTEKIKDGVIDLLISRVQISDAGVYKCSAVYTPDKDTRNFTLRIQAQPKIKICNKNVNDSSLSFLRGTVTRFYPVDINISWFKDGELLQNFQDKPQQNVDGTYNMSSIVIMNPTEEDRKKTFSCIVKHESIPDGLQEKFQLVFEGLCQGCIGKMCSTGYDGVDTSETSPTQNSLPSMEDIRKPDMFSENKKTTLNCNITYSLHNLKVCWFVKKKGKVRPEPIEHDDKKRCTFTSTSSLLFTPKLEHQESELICKMEHPSLPVPIEKSTGPIQVNAKPVLRKPRWTMCGDKMEISLELDNFYPRDIDFTWKLNQDSLKSIEKYNRKRNCYSVETKCTLAEKDFKNPDVMIRVSWSHITIDSSESIVLSPRHQDFPWRPKVKDIKLMGRQLGTLQCEIQNYYPNTLSVSWLVKKKNTSDDEYESLEKRIYDGKRQRNDTYYTRATCKLDPAFISCKETRVMCRVEHISLEKPIEKLWTP